MIIVRLVADPLILIYNLAVVCWLLVCRRVLLMVRRFVVCLAIFFVCFDYVPGIVVGAWGLFGRVGCFA